ncbi:MAG: excinuclease ABC subunit UvrC [Oscillospiraceae bacterium]|nr:excinuclease ABC subunit UvrC [Oscillospiraceae bacterium]
MDKIAQLREKANKLPLQPGVYIMMDASGQVIYVGKAKALKNRVTSYFRGEHLPKVAAMVSHVDDFSVIVAGSEFEALVLENSLIKRHQPHYNILLRDDKTYPFLRLDWNQEYPAFTIVNRIQPDGAQYYGPYGGRSVSKGIVDALAKALKLPGCTRRFPRDIGKDRPCLNWHMGACEGWCRGEPGQAQYRERMEQAVQILTGGAGALMRELEAQMLQASEELRFERAADLRDRMLAVKELSNQQTVINAARADTDAVGFRRGAKTAFVVLHYANGDLAGKDTELMPEPLEEDGAAVSALVRQYYTRRGAWPRTVLLPMELEDREPLSELLSQMAGHRVELAVPKRGVKRELVQAAERNAQDEGLRAESEAERRSKTLQWLQKLLGLAGEIRRIESFDISNTGDFGIVASMVVFEDGRPAKSKYRRFRMKEVRTQDDFASMHEAVGRRMAHYAEGDEKFMPLPDLLLIDGGVGQVGAAYAAMAEQGITGVPVFGMVKDDRHRTRALTTPDGREIGLAGSPAVFALVGNIQEETHRFAIEYHRTLRKKTIASQLDDISGVGPKRRAALLKRFKSVRAISRATEQELAQAVPRSAARAVYAHFHQEEEKP